MVAVAILADTFEGADVPVVRVGDEIAFIDKRRLFNPVEKILDEPTELLLIERVLKGVLYEPGRRLSVHGLSALQPTRLFPSCPSNACRETGSLPLRSTSSDYAPHNDLREAVPEWRFAKRPAP